MANAVTFDYTQWKALYPELSTVPEPAANGYFDQAGMFWRNDGTSPATTDGMQRNLMNLMTAHIAALFRQSQGMPAPGNAQDANSPVGRINSAAQGSVNMQVELLSPGPNPSDLYLWLSQTKYGLMFWAATSTYRSAHYVRGRMQAGGLPLFGGRRSW